MRLRAWIKAAGRGAMAQLARQSGVSYSLIITIVNEGKLVEGYPTAKKISDATGGAVSIDELCQPPRRRPAMKRKRRKPTAAAVDAAA